MAAPEKQDVDWPSQYRHLLASANLDAKSVIDEALPPSEQDRPALLSLSQCLTQPELLRHQLLKDYDLVGGARALRTHLSVNQQDLALSVIAPLALVLFRDGRAPLPDARRVFLGPAHEGATTARWFHAPSTTSTAGAEDFIQELGSLASEWYPVFRKALGVSPGAYWSSMALGLGAPFSAVWNRADAHSVCTLAQAWLEDFKCDASRFVDWLPAEFNGQLCAIPQRKGCCLKYLLPEGGYCGTCGVHRQARFAALNRPCQSPAPRQWQPGR